MFLCVHRHDLARQHQNSAFRNCGTLEELDGLHDGHVVVPVDDDVFGSFDRLDLSDDVVRAEDDDVSDTYRKARVLGSFEFQRVDHFDVSTTSGEEPPVVLVAEQGAPDAVRRVLQGVPRHGSAISDLFRSLFS